MAVVTIDCAAMRRRASEFTSAPFARPEPDPLSRMDSLLCAYGYLWLFQGDSHRDPNAGFAFEARRQLQSVLTKDQQSRGIEVARNLAKANGLSFAGPVG